MSGRPYEIASAPETGNLQTAVGFVREPDILESKFVSPSEYYNFSDPIDYQNFIMQVIYLQV
jgi:hypothetical protein